MLFDAVVKYNLVLIVLCGAVFAATGLFFRRSSPASRADRDNLVYADGFQGATVGTLVVIAIVVSYIEEPRSILLLKEQASLITVYSILGCMQQIDRFRRSLRQ